MDGIHLTDAPSLGAGKGLREEVRDIVRANVRQILIDCLADKLGHAYAVASGKTHFREVFVREMGAHWGNNRGDADHVADTCFQFIEKAWRDKYPGLSAFAFLDAVHVESPQSQAAFEREVEDAWEVEIAGSQEAMERHYVGSARVRKGKEIFSSFWQKDPSKAVN